MTTATWSDLLRDKRGPITAIIVMGVAMHAVDVFIVATALPSIVADIGGAGFYTWSMMLYMVASITATAGAAPLRGAMGDRDGFLLAAIVFLVGTVGCALSPAMAALLFARVVQGAGGGLMLALGYAFVHQFYPEAMRTRMLSAASGVWGVAALLGPLLGGGFSQIGWWRGAFWAGAPIILLCCYLAWRHLPAGATAEARARPPYGRLALLAVGVLAVASSGQVPGLAWRLALIALGALLLALTFHRDARAGRPLFPSRPWSILHPVGNGYAMTFLVGITIAPMGIFIPLVVQRLHGIAPFTSGYIHAILSLSWTASALLTAGVGRRWANALILTGPPVVLLGAVGLLRFHDGGALWPFIVAIALTGFGVGLFFTHVISATMSNARPGEEAITATAMPMTQQLGIAFGAALSGVIANAAGLDAGIARDNVAAAAVGNYIFAIVAAGLLSLLGVKFALRSATARAP